MSRTAHVIENIRKHREKRNYTQEYMGSCIGVGQNGYSKIELGITKLTVNHVLMIASALKIDPASLLQQPRMNERKASQANFKFR